MRGSALILMMDDADQTRSVFERLSQGWTETTPLAIRSWGDLFGKFTDRFGVQ